MIPALAMPVTCAVCGKKFTSIGEVADHMSEINKGRQGDTFAGFSEQIEEIVRNEKEMENFIEAKRGFAHTKFRDNNGILMPEEVTHLYILMTGGAHWCVDCRAPFPNNFRLVEHCKSTGHGERLRPMIERVTRQSQEFERRWFW